MKDLSKESLMLTLEEIQTLAEAMNTKYRLARRERLFQISVEKKGKGIYVTVLLANTEQSFYYPVEARILYEAEELSPRNAALFLIDYIDMYFEEFLLEEDESLYIPIDWADHQYDAIDFQIRGQIINKMLENMADELLQQSPFPLA